MSAYSAQILVTSPILYWQLEDTSVGFGSISNQGSLAGYTGGIQSVGVTVRVPGPLQDVASYGMSFLGTSASFIDIHSGIDKPSVSHSGTIICWFKGNGSPSGYPYSIADAGGLSLLAVQAGNASTTNFSLRRNGGAVNQVGINSNASLSDGVWHMLAVVSTNSGTNLHYHDGVAVATTVNTLAGTATTSDWFGDMASSTYFSTIGGRRIVNNSNSVPFKGSLSQVSVHNTALTASDILNLYNAAVVAVSTTYRRQNRRIYPV